MLKQTAFYLFVFLILFSACNSKDSGSKQSEQPVVDSLADKSTVVKTYPDLVPGEIELEEDCFGEIIELQGEQKTTDAIFEVRETQMLVRDSLLIMANLNSENMFMAFSLPGFGLVKSFGKMGRGPGEFQYPQLVPAKNEDCLCYIYEKANNHIFSLQKDLTISALPFKLTDSQIRQQINDKQLVSFSSHEFVYAESVKGGKAVFDFSFQNDSIQNRMIYNLSFSEKHQSWASYIGDFGANAGKQRVVYAYKYFKQLVFIDLKNNTSRSLKFNSGEAKKGNAVSIMSPENTTHYWGMSAGNDFVYILYSGRSPVDVTKEWRKKMYYIFVEKYDWNGNPVAKYKLDNWGYFCVDEQRNKLYLASVNDANPFFVYNLE
ncbi:BF3164 family lipoprotein [Maribellus maritimus]|uniref:BF3164 family lipoprotein n=1 Tax=Maribellus maritimus TaxID=2870838 RepID=UPI001EEAC153|nr:BF3164 family lipoprotein [Maribellus maritimus]MCG6188041.1 TolB-like 6-bladed beta-propeller domain-containing protein [Maribellus maritimus]